LDVSPTVFEIWTHKTRKQLVSAPHPCLTPTIRKPVRTRAMGLLYGEIS